MKRLITDLIVTCEEIPYNPDIGTISPSAVKRYRLFVVVLLVVNIYIYIYIYTHLITIVVRCYLKNGLIFLYFGLVLG